MLVLTRKAGKQIMIGDDIVIVFLGMRGDEARLGISAPSHVAIDRAEIYRDKVRDGTIPPRPAPVPVRSRDDHPTAIPTDFLDHP